eukprot:6261878-Amphidinium_carterae.1
MASTCRNSGSFPCCTVNQCGALRIYPQCKTLAAQLKHCSGIVAEAASGVAPELATSDQMCLGTHSITNSLPWMFLFCLGRSLNFGAKFPPMRLTA